MLSSLLVLLLPEAFEDDLEADEVDLPAVDDLLFVGIKKWF
jgi:hypothetical protein